MSIPRLPRTLLFYASLLYRVGAAIAALVAVCVVVVRYVGPRLDTDAKRYVDQTLPVIVDGWDPERLLAEASPELIAALPGERLAILEKDFARRLGGLTRYNGATGEARIRLAVFPWFMAIEGRCVAEVEFHNGSARIFVRTVRRDGKWRYMSMNVQVTPSANTSS